MEIDKLTVDNAADGRNDINNINSIKSGGNHKLVADYPKQNDSLPFERVKFEGLDESDDQKLPKIPDGGWGWVVVITACLVLVYTGGLTVSFGLITKHFSEYFGTTQLKMSLVRDLYFFTPSLAGPIMSILVDRYGCRVMTMIAGILSTIGFLLFSFSNSVEMLCLTFGLLSGLAIGILQVTAVVSVALWFDKKRNLAVSLALFGSWLGRLICYPLIMYLLQFGFENRTIWLAGTSLNMCGVCVCGAIMRNPEWLEIKQKRKQRLSKDRSRMCSSTGAVSSKSLGDESVFLSPEEQSLRDNGRSPVYILETSAEIIAEAEEPKATMQMNAEPWNKRTNSAIHFPTFIQQNKKTWYGHCFEVLKSTFNFVGMFNKFHFLMFNIASLILSISIIVPYDYLHLFMMARGIVGGEMMYVVIGVSSSIGLVVLGFAGDLPCINVIKTHALCLFICGLSVTAYPFITKYSILTIDSAILGFTFACCYSYTPSILIELVTIDRFIVAYGFILLSRGIGDLFGPPIVGMIFDLTWASDLIFYAGGVCLVISGLCVGVIAYTKDLRMCGSAPLLKEAEQAEKAEEEAGGEVAVSM